MKPLSYILRDYVKNIENDIEIKDISCDPVKCKKDELLFLINQKAINAYNSSPTIAAAIITEKHIEQKREIPIYTVSCIREVVAMAFARFYCKDLSKLKFIGITGTNGKSSTAIILEKILCDYGYKVGMIGTGKIKFGANIISNEFYSMTTPPPEILYPAISRMQSMGAEIIVMEVSSHALVQKRVAAIKFDIGMFTNLSNEHLDYHKNINDYFLAKLKLFEQSKCIIVNGDDEYGKRIAQKYKHAETCGQKNEQKVMLSQLQNHGFLGTKFNYKSDLEEIQIDLMLPGEYNLYNAMLAMRAAEKMNIPKKFIKKSIEQIEKIDGRFEVINDKVMVVIDYAHTATAFSNLLKILNSNKIKGQKLISVFGCGGERDKEKRCLIGMASEKYSDITIVTSDNPRGEDPCSIISDITKNMSKEFIIVVDRRAAIKKAISLASDGDIVAIIGKGPEKYIISCGEYYPFDERQIVAEALKERALCE